MAEACNKGYTLVEGAVVIASRNLGANLGTEDFSTVTDSNGQYWFAELPQATYTLKVTELEGLPDQVETSIDWSAATGTQTQDFNISCGISISGAVSGTTALMVFVEIYPAAGGDAVATTTAGANGAYAFVNVPSGTYKVAAVALLSDGSVSDKWHATGGDTGADIDNATSVEASASLTDINISF